MTLGRGIILRVTTTAPSAGGSQAIYLYRQALAPEARGGKDLFRLAVAAVNETIAYSVALNQLYDMKPPGMEVEDVEQYVDDLKEELDRYIAYLRDPHTIDHHNVRFRQDTHSSLVSRLRLDLHTVPDLATLSNLMTGHDSVGEPIAGKHYHRGRPGSEAVAFATLVWSASKPVSLAWSMAGPNEREQIMEVHRNAVDVVMTTVEERAGLVTSGGGGKGGHERGHVTWICFDHAQSRAGDPDLHTHVVLLNTVHSQSSGRLGSLRTFKLHGQGWPLSAQYNRALSEGLRRIGIDAWYDSEHRETKIRGISDEVLETFSNRRAQGKAWAEAYAIKQGWEFDRLSDDQQRRLVAYGTVVTRSKDIKTGNTEEWRRRAQATGWEIPSLFATLIPTHYHTQHEELEWDDRAPRLSW